MRLRRIHLFGTLGGGAAFLLVATAALAGGAVHASARFVDATGAEIGWARLTEDATGVVHVNVHVRGLAPGLHGIHIHSRADCDPFADAGPHYNPGATQHGLDNPAGPHAGDLPNLIANEAGIGHLDATTDRVTLNAGPATLFDTTAGVEGSAFIIHANPDDQVTDATNGGSGGRIACAVIVAD